MGKRIKGGGQAGRKPKSLRHLRHYISCSRDNDGCYRGDYRSSDCVERRWVLIENKPTSSYVLAFQRRRPLAVTLPGSRLHYRIYTRVFTSWPVEHGFERPDKLVPPYPPATLSLILAQTGEASRGEHRGADRGGHRGDDDSGHLCRRCVSESGQ